ncbi:MAG: arginine--tRNA ligase [Epsilonproteobacteria bacterium]|nr:arginine--tRNA ligase [Campylobacterota bacterium]
MKIKEELNSLFNEALEKIGATKRFEVNEATKVEFGDYQFNGAMPLAKELKKNPRDIAKDIIEAIPKNNIISSLEIAGAGFINIKISSTFLEKAQLNIFKDSRAFIPKKDPIRVVVDYSSPNMAKQMHVGHLRSTIIGDAIANLFEFLGDDVIRQNHIGDWGTQFGMLIAYLEEIKEEDASLEDLEEFYKMAKAKFDSDSEFAKRAREYVVKLQRGDSYCKKLWKRFIDISLSHCQEVYDKLDVSLSLENVRGESSYNDMLDEIIKELEEKGLLVESEGAKCVFIDGFKAPLIVQKKDGGYLYATTDLAAIKFRAKELGAKRISYVVDARQSEHFKMVFAVAKMANFVDEDVKLEHISFGMMLNKDGKPFKTREGGVVKLVDLLDEAIKRAKETIKNREELSDEELLRRAHIIGIGALKYADLSINRESNYIFDWDKLLSLDGNTSLYQQYAYARIRSILRNFGEIKDEFKIESEIERRLALKVASFEDILIKAYKEAMPNIIANFLYELTTLFMRFYETHPILKEEDKIKQNSRALLAANVAKTIKIGLNILGIGVLERI